MLYIISAAVFSSDLCILYEEKGLISVNSEKAS